MRERVLIVGAGGFVGGFLAEEGLRRGYEVWAGLRHSTSRKYLTDKRLKFIEFDFDDPASLAGTMASTLPEGEKWDWIVYNLGATKCLRFSDFSRINAGILRSFLEALKESGKIPGRFLYMSSLSAVGIGDEKGGKPFTEEMIPQPDTRYGASKLKAEMELTMSGIPYIIFRPTGIYGPRDHDYYLMFESIAKGFDFSVGYRRQYLSFIYVEDLARAVFDALEHGKTGEVYNIAEEQVYSQAEFRRMAADVIGKKMVIPMKMPLWAVKGVSWVAEKIGIIKGKPSTLNTDKFRIMKQRNWAVSTDKAARDFGFRAQVPLSEGIRRSVEWYRKEGWLK